MQDDDFVIGSEEEENKTRQGASEADIADEEARADTHVKKLKHELEAIKKERQEYLDGWQRAKADYVNVLKRSEDERKSERAKGIEKAVEELLPAFDSLERAKEHGEVPAGFQGIAKQLETAFASLGLEAIGTIGEPFDPNLHEAYGQDPASSKDEDDTVAAVLERGYRLGDKVIRPAKVRVAHYA